MSTDWEVIQYISQLVKVPSESHLYSYSDTFVVYHNIHCFNVNIAGYCGFELAQSFHVKLSTSFQAA